MNKHTRIILVLGLVAAVMCAAAVTQLVVTSRHESPAAQTAQSRKLSSHEATDSAGRTNGSSAGGSDSDAQPGSSNSTDTNSGTGAASGSGSSTSTKSGTQPGAGSATGTGSSGSSGSGSSSSGSAGSAASGAAAPSPAPTPAPAPKPATVTITIDCRTVLSNMSKLKSGKASAIPAGGTMLSSRSITLQDSDSVFTVLQRACRSAGLALNYTQMPAYNSVYLKGIGGLDEFDCGALSGWLYSVNGTFPGTGCSQYKLKAGDKIALRYTCNGGPDIGANSAR